MRFSTLAGARTVTLVTYFAILLFNVYTLSLYINGQLTLYIHPRYVLFTVALNLISLAACAVGFVLAAWRTAGSPSVSDDAVADPGSDGRVPWRPSITVLVAVLVLLAAYALPARTLSSETADQRSANFNSAQARPSTGGAGDTLALFGADTTRLTVADWVMAFNARATPDSYVGKEVDVVGFVFHPEDTPANIFYVSRFSVTCCAVDARPLGLPVYSPGWQEDFGEDSWVRVSGSFTETEEDVPEPVIVTPESIELTQQPDNPYVN